GRPAGKVVAALQVLVVPLVRLGAGVLEGVLGELPGQAEGTDDRQRVHAGLAARAEDLSDDALAAVVRAGEAQHLDDDLVLGLGPFAARIADVDAVAEDRAVHADEALGVALEVGADELARGPLEDADDLTARAEVGPLRLAADADEHSVASGRIA